MKKIWAVFLMVIMMTGCTFPGNLLFDPPDIEQGFVIPTVMTAVEVQNATPLSGETQINCAWAWTSEPLTEETGRLQEALRTGGYTGVEGSVAAYGENCLDPTTNKIVRFAVMQTDFYFNVSIDNPKDKQAMGEIAERILLLVKQFPPGEVPGPNKGYIGIHYSNGIQDKNLWLRLEDGEKAYGDGLRGEALFDALDQY